MVTDVEGKVTGTVAVAILSEIPIDARLHLGAEAKLVAVYLASGDEYVFTGPADIRFSADVPSVLSGTQPSKSASSLSKLGNITIKPVNVAQAGFVIRSESSSVGRIKLLSLSGTKVLEPSPEFRWQAVQPGLKYRVVLIDDASRLLYQSDSEATSLLLPDSVVLVEGVDHTWKVSGQSPEGESYVGNGDFSIASAELRALAAALRPPTVAPVSQRVAYAVWLEQVGLRDEARKFWRVLSAERPDDENLKALAVE